VGYLIRMCQNLVALPRMRAELLDKIASLEKRAADFEAEMSQQVGSLARALRENQRARDARKGHPARTTADEDTADASEPARSPR
jgi:hypothetical protein